MTAQHEVVSHDEWLKARKAFLAKEKAFTKLRDELNAQRRALPWEPVAKSYTFEGPEGDESLSDLFAGRSQLIVYHFMFAPNDTQGCKHCSFWADNFNEIIVHLNQRDVTMLAVSRAPLEKLEAYKKRMGWSFKWVSSGDSTFNYDFYASFTPDEVANKRALFNFVEQNPGNPDREGISVFHKNEAGELFHTYSSYARGIDLMNTAYNYLDLTPKGRDEGDRGPSWVKRHDEYAK